MQAPPMARSVTELTVDHQRDSLFKLCTASLIQVWCFSLYDDLKCDLVTKVDLEKLEKRYNGNINWIIIIIVDVAK